MTFKAERKQRKVDADRKSMENNANVIKKDIEDLEIAFQKLEQEKTSRDHSICNLNSEVQQQDEVMKIQVE